MIDFLTKMITSVGDVITAGVAAAAAVYVASVWWKTKALVPTMTSIVLAAVVVWATGNVGQLEESVHQDSLEWLGEGVVPE